MQIKTVLFDLDGTLLPMDQELFVKDYLSRLAAYMVPYGYDPKKVTDAVMEGIITMVRNDGSMSNEEAFWKCFAKHFGEDCIKDIPIFEEFYRTEFQKVKASCGFNAEAKKVIELVKQRDMKAVLATNPLFPQIATYSRVRWAGLEPEDFEYITTYENNSCCKPNPKYYEEILSKLNLKADECAMVGNDSKEDTVPSTMGIPVFLLTDCLIDKGGDISKFKHGGFDELKDFIDDL
ncbi:MAG: HAD family hydrolase, partial [Oscillospiraceae bacterium]|nr:HAD family hydrolase [Oscillospiraceae bacterium]